MTKLLYLYYSNPIWISSGSEPYPKPEELARRINNGEWALPDDVWNQITPPDPMRFNATVHGSIVIVTPAAPPRVNNPNITLRQREVMMLLSQGLTGKQAAQRFNRSPRWLRMQVRAVKQALGVSTCAAAISMIHQSR